MRISRRVWDSYITALRRGNEKAGAEMRAFLDAHNWRTDNLTRQACVDFGYALATKYGEAAGAIACEMYDNVVAASMVAFPPAEPAPTATYDETAKAVIGTMKTNNEEVIAGAISRLVKMAGVDTTMQNAIRDGAEWAWIPVGDTCAFCITLASRGWQPASRAALKGNHAEHIHANCDCTYAIRFNSNDDVAGYDPEEYLQMYKDAPLDHWNTADGKPPAGHESAERNTSTNRINAMRRAAYGKTGSEEIEV